MILIPNTTMSKTVKLSAGEIARQMLQYLSSLRHAHDKQHRVRPTLHAICKLSKLEKMCEAFVRLGVTTEFDALIDPHTHVGALFSLSRIYYRFCQLKQVFDIYSSVDDDDEKAADDESRQQAKWLIFKHLKVLLFYEDDIRVVSYALAAIWNLILNSANSDREIQVIVSDIYSSEIETIYLRKFHQTRLIFAGFLRSSTSLLLGDFVPVDVSSIMYAYYNCYEHMKINYMQRLFSFFSKNSGYPPRIKDVALMCLQRTVQFASEHTAYELHALYDLVKHCKLILQDAHITDDTFWVVQNLHTNLRCVKSSNVVEIMVDRFVMTVKKEIAASDLKVTLKIVVPLICTLQNLQSQETITTLLMEYALMESMVRLMKEVLSDEVVFCNNERMEEALSKIVELLGHLLNIEVVSEICVQQIEVHGGVTVLKDITSGMYDGLKATDVARVQRMLESYFQQNK